MKIVRLDIENIKRVVAVSITPEGHLVEITGKNGAGKTSTLNAIWWALGGRDTVQEQPIRKGADEGRVDLVLDDYLVTRIFTRPKDGSAPFTTRLEVKRRDGTPVNKPQTTLDSFLGELTFDPLAFLRMDPDERFELLRSFVPDVDFAEIERQHKADYDQRTDVNRRAKEARTQAQAIPADMGITGEPIDTAAMVDDLERAGLHNTEIAERKARRDKAAAEIESLRADARRMRMEAEKLRKSADELDRYADERVTRATGLDEKLKAAEPLPEPVDTAALREAIAQANATNVKIEQRDRRLERMKEAQAFEKESASLTARMEARAQQAAAAIARATIPVEGISFGDLGSRAILLGGVPFEQASDSQQLRASIDMAIAKNPKLKVILVRDGSLLDHDSLKLVAERAAETDVQVWMERVTEGGPGGFVIEDGKLKSVPEPEAEKREVSRPRRSAK
jgi:energy-coupling factor transporter ATP-binding protein EcfA2